MRGGGVECQGIPLHQPQRLESDDGFELALQDVEVFAAVVADGPPALGGLAAGFVHNLDEVDPAVVHRGKALPTHTRREFDGVAIVGPLRDARSTGTGGATPWSVDRRRARPFPWFDVIFAEQEIEGDGKLG